MGRYFDGKEIELLAPCGTFDIFKDVIGASCDAVYFGGPGLNMRMIRKGYNFSREEVRAAIQIAHEHGKKAYITVNSLLNPGEIDEAMDYLAFLEVAGPDALIVQDYAVLQLKEQLGLHVPVHASVMMNVHNRSIVEALQKLGVTRVVLSRELDLRTARWLHDTTGMEMEYFVHGDMCSVHGGNCLYSSMLFGMSSNRGRCLKPCRWAYRVKRGGHVYPTEYPLAAKDMYMYEHLPELIESGITSFKIEGRMRDASFVTKLVNSYGDAIDRYLDDPLGFNRAKDAEFLYENRKRDFSTAYAFGRPGLGNINSRYEGTGKFYSSGKMFSTPTEERELTTRRVNQVKAALTEYAVEHPAMPEQVQLCVRVNSFEQAKMAIDEGVSEVYLAGDVLQPDRPFTHTEIEQLAAIKGQTKLIMGLPRMMTEQHTEQYRHWLTHRRPQLDGLLATSIGAAYEFAKLGYPIIGDSSLNVCNEEAARLYASLGVERMVSSLELHLKPLAELVSKSSLVKEITVHGSPVVMYMEHDLYENTEVLEPIADEHNKYVDDQILVLMTDKGENPVYRDQHGRNHLMMAKELCFLPFVDELRRAGITHMRIEGCTYTAAQLRAIIEVYRGALEQPGLWKIWYAELPHIAAGYTLGTLEFDVEGGVRHGEAESEQSATNAVAEGAASH